MAGYFYDRKADGVHDELQAKTLFIDDGKTRIALVACDLVRLPRAAVTDARQRIEKRLGIPAAHVLISATHSHTGPAPTTEYASVLASRRRSSRAATNRPRRESHPAEASESWKRRLRF